MVSFPKFKFLNLTQLPFLTQAQLQTPWCLDYTEIGCVSK